MLCCWTAGAGAPTVNLIPRCNGERPTPLLSPAQTLFIGGHNKNSVHKHSSTEAQTFDRKFHYDHKFILTQDSFRKVPLQQKFNLRPFRDAFLLSHAAAVFDLGKVTTAATPPRSHSCDGVDRGGSCGFPSFILRRPPLARSPSPCPLLPLFT